MSDFFSFVIPCYYSENTILSVLDEIHNKMKERSEIGYEIIAVNDCSPDNVLSLLVDLTETDKTLKILNLAKNGGKTCAIMAGYSVVSGNIIINLDDDGQCPVDRLWELVQPLYDGYDACFARYPQKNESAFKRFGSKVNSFMATQLVSKPKELYTSNFSAIKRFVTDEMIKYTNPYPYFTGLLVRSTSKIANVDMVERNRIAGVGHYNFRKSFTLWMNGFTAFSVKPLRIATVLGFVCAFIGFVFGVYTIINKIINPEVLMGYSSLMAVLLFIGGMIMVMLGLIGEYIGRMYICINNSPQYVIRDRINFDCETASSESNKGKQAEGSTV